MSLSAASDLFLFLPLCQENITSVSLTRCALVFGRLLMITSLLIQSGFAGTLSGAEGACGDLKAGPLNSGCYFSFLNQRKGQHLVGLMLRVDCFIWLYSV